MLHTSEESLVFTPKPRKWLTATQEAHFGLFQSCSHISGHIFVLKTIITVHLPAGMIRLEVDTSVSNVIATSCNLTLSGKTAVAAISIM